MSGEVPVVSFVAGCWGLSFFVCGCVWSGGVRLAARPRRGLGWWFSEVVWGVGAVEAAVAPALPLAGLDELRRFMGRQHSPEQVSVVAGGPHRILAPVRLGMTY